MRYRISHRTEYSYDDDVDDSLGIAHLAPRPLPWQRVDAHTLAVDPAPDDERRDLDFFGNPVAYFQVTSPHRRLTVEAHSDVWVEDTWYDQSALTAAWEGARPRHSAAHGAWAASDFAIASPQVAQVAAAAKYAAVSLTPQRPLGEAVRDLAHRIHEDFEYDPTATTVTSTVAEVIRTGAGVCQDFAHLAIACFRSHGLAARYVSGYLATDPPPGTARVVGADASHAWVAVWVPGSDEWYAVDPTNDQVAGDRYVTVAWGRDYADVVPLKGVIFTEAKHSTLRVAVDVVPEAV